MDHLRFRGMDFKWRDRNLSGFIKNIFVCVWKLNENRIGLKQHEGEYMMTGVHFLGELYHINTVS